MLVFWKQRLVFLAVPKTGTTAWADALGPHASMVVRDPPELKHAPLYRYNNFYRPMFDRLSAGPFDIIAVVREPLDWLASWYRYRRRASLDGSAHSTAGLSFDRFVQDYCAAGRPAHAEVGSQARFLEQRRNGVSVSHVFAYEAQERLVGYLEDRLGLTITLPVLNASPEADVSLPETTRHRAEAFLADDFALWRAALR